MKSTRNNLYFLLIASTIGILIWNLSKRKVRYVNSRGETIYEIKNYFKNEVKTTIVDSLDRKLEEFKRINGNLTGEFKTYYPTGKLRAIANFKNNIKTGKYLEYYTSGKLMKELMIRNNENHGTCYSYNQDGTLKSTSIYFDGSLNYYTDNVNQTTKKVFKPKFISNIDTIKTNEITELSFCIHKDALTLLGQTIYIYYNYLPIEKWDETEIEIPTDSIEVEKGCVHSKFKIKKPGNYMLYYFADRMPSYIEYNNYEFRIFTEEFVVL